MEDVESRGEGDDIPGNIAKATQTGSLEAVCWDCITDLLDGEVWELKFVTVRVQKHSGVGLLVDIAAGGLFSNRREGGEGGR